LLFKKSVNNRITATDFYFIYIYIYTRSVLIPSSLLFFSLRLLANEIEEIQVNPPARLSQKPTPRNIVSLISS